MILGFGTFFDESPDGLQPNDHETAASPRQMKDAVREAAERGRSNFYRLDPDT
jgi:hypothetical protein